MTTIRFKDKTYQILLRDTDSGATYDLEYFIAKVFSSGIKEAIEKLQRDIDSLTTDPVLILKEWSDEG